jgi:hypothetical protein
MWTPNMRWFVEITPLGAKPGSVTPLCVEAPQWKHALQKARALRGDEAPLSNFSIDLLDDGYRAIDPIARLRYEVRRAPDNTPITTSVPPPPPAEPAPAKPTTEPPKAPETKKADLSGTIAYASKGEALIAEQAKAEPVKPADAKKADLSGTIAYASKGEALIAEQAKAEPVKPADAKKADLSGTIAYASKGEALIAEEAKAKPAEAKKPEAPKAEPAKSTPPPAGLPSFKVLSTREEDPTESSPLTYREQVYAVEAGTPEDEARRLVLDRLEHVRAGLDGARSGKLVNLAVFDHAFQGKPQRRPIVTLTWKDWKGNEPELQYPQRDGHSIRPASPSMPPKSAPMPAAPASAKPSVPPSAAPSGAPAAVPASTLNSAKPTVQPKPSPEPEVPVVAASAPQPKVAEPAPKPVKVESVPKPEPHPAKEEPAVVAAPVVAIGGPDSAAPTRPVPTVASPTTPTPIEAVVTEPPSKPAAKSEPPPKPAPKSEPPPPPKPVAKSEPPPKPVAKSEPPPPPKSEPPPKPVTKSEPPPKPVAKSEPPPKPVAKSEPPPKAEPAKVEPKKAEPAKVEPKKAEPAKAAAKTEPAKAAAKTEPAKPAAKEAAKPKKRLSGDDLITELFEACGDLHFLRDALEGAEFVLHLAMEKLPSEVALVSFFDMNKREFVIARQSGGPRTALAARQPERAPLAFQAMRKRHAIVVSDKEGAAKAMDDRWRAIGVELKSLVCAPVELGGRFLGLIEIANPLDGTVFNEGDGNALTYIGQQFAEFVAERGVVVDDEHIRETKPAPPQARISAAPSSKKR